MAFIFPTITDSAVINIGVKLGLSDTAFSGDGGHDPRIKILQSLESCDVEACPGSGKTTLLVAKLAILAGLWSAQRNGLCVLSHTNVARREIEQRLGNTAEGQRLLSYPHYIGTIHGFINEFLAIPWVRSLGYPIEMIDNDVTLDRRWRKLSPKTVMGLEKNFHNQGILRVCNPDFDLGEIRWGKGILGRNTPTYLELVKVCKDSVKEGYFCHDEMFVWAVDLINKIPAVKSHLRDRFPLLFVDEVQDNSELQSSLLHQLFIEGDSSVVRQRYGDANQAIFQSTIQTDDAATDKFPIPDIRADIPNSFRFGNEIAYLADPFAPSPQGLQGDRKFNSSVDSDTTGRHTIFLFDDDTIGGVLAAYANHLIETFSERERREGIFTAIGAVHSPGGDDNIPRHVGQYWPPYDHSICRSDTQPQTFIQYVSSGHQLSAIAGESHFLTQKVAEAVIRLTKMIDTDLSSVKHKRKHRHILMILEDKPDIKNLYIDLIAAFAIERCALTVETWVKDFQPVIINIAQGITGGTVDSSKEAQEFLKWETPASIAAEQDGENLSDNIFRYPTHQPTIAIRVGSIHAAKGETHTATLVLDTFYRSHHLKTLKPWLIGKKNGGDKESAALQSRMRLHYVAMTRPSRLLCLAMREEVFNQNEIEKLLERGWKIAKLRPLGTEWL